MAHFFRVSIVRILMACAIYVRFFSAGCIFMNKRDTFFRQLFTYIQVTKGEKRMHLMRRGRCTGLTNKWARSKGFVVDDRLNIDNNIRIIVVIALWCTYDIHDAPTLYLLEYVIFLCCTLFLLWFRTYFPSSQFINLFMSLGDGTN